MVCSDNESRICCLTVVAADERSQLNLGVRHLIVTMFAHFLVEETFSVSSRESFVVHGRIVDGVVRRGQRVRAPSGLDAPVEAIEFVLLSVSPGRENPALVFRYRDVDELARWQALGLTGQTLELEDGGEFSRDRDAAV
jgi:hypothetical protein